MSPVQYVEHLQVADADIEKIADDNTIGLFRAAEKLRGEVYVDVNRLREALILADEAFGDAVLELGIVEHPDAGDTPLVLLLPMGGGSEAVALAPRATKEDGTRPNGGGEA